MNGVGPTHETSASQHGVPAEGPPASAAQPPRPGPTYPAPPGTMAPGVVVAAAPPRDPRSKSPVLACILSLMPGLGQVYVGYYPRGFAHSLVIASIITFLGFSDPDNPIVPLAAFFMVFFWLYNVIDAGRRASLYNQALAGTESIEPPGDLKLPSLQGSVLGGSLFILAGVILLSHTLFGIPLVWLRSWWPVVPILFGVYLLIKALIERDSKEA